MKSKAIFSFAALAMVVGTMALVSDREGSGNSPLHYQPRSAGEQAAQGIEGALEHYRMLRANPETGEFDVRAIMKAREDVEAFSALNKTSALNLQWDELGPDNIGGRTRAIVVDRSNSNKVYAGSVSGGLWYSETAGGSWKQHPSVDYSMSVASITQAANGDIYVGTGEGHYGNYGTGSGGILGGGVWKSTDNGATFARLTSTIPASYSSNVDWVNVNEMAADPSNSNRIYAATQRGLRVTDDGGTTWFNPVYIGTSTVNNTKEADDVEVASDGTVLAVVGDELFLSASGNDGSFTNLSTTSGSNLPTSGISRIEVAFAPSDPNYIYAAAGSSGGDVYNIYQSKDKGATFNSIVTPGNNGSIGTTSNFNIYNGQAGYDNALAVFPDNKEKIIVGGVQLWSWENGTGWIRIGSEAKSPFNPYYVHADKHEFTFDPKNSQTLYIGCDGGVFKSSDGAATFKEMNKGYAVTQYYAVGYQLSGDFVAGGAQDNGTTMMSTVGTMEGFNSPKAGVDMMGGDGCYVDFSFSQPEAMFASSQQGNVARSATATEGGSFGGFFENRMTSLGTNGYGGPFVTTFRLWEGFWGDPTLPANLYDNLFAIGLGIRDAVFGTGGGIWITREALDFGKTPLWYNCSLINGTVSCMEFSADGDVLYVGTSNGELYRIDSLSYARSFHTGDVSGDSTKVRTTVIETFTKPVTGIGVNMADANNVIVTLGGYGSATPYVYKSTNALGAATFSSIQGNLPFFPVYDAEVDRFNSNMIIVGCDFGVYASLDGGATWTEENTNLGKVPVFMIRRQDRNASGFSSMLYLATHGRGAWRSGTLTSINEKDLKPVAVNDVNLFPNPLRNGIGNITFNLGEAALVEAVVYDMSGKVVWKREPIHTPAGSQKISFYGQELAAGSYIVNLRVNNENHSSKLLVTK